MTLILSGTDGLSDVDGSAATPAIRGTDANTGIFFPAADTIAFSEGGVEAMRIDSSGNVGIGVTPTTTLDVKAALGRIKLTSSTGTNNALVLFNNTGGNAYVGLDTSVGSLTAAYALNLYHEGAYPITFSTNTAERMRIDSNGVLGIGITPSATWSSTLVKALQIADTGASFSSYTSFNTGGKTAFFTANAVYDGVSGSGWKYMGSNAASQYALLNNTHSWNIAASGTAGNAITWTQAMTLDSSGNLLVGPTSGSSHVFSKDIAVGSIILGITNASQNTALFYGTDAAGNSTSNTGFIIRKVNATGRSINAAGTINASGADYAEYMTKAGDFVAAKGDVVGINSQGKLTNVFADAVSFCVKSTDPSYVGGDVWGNEEALGLVQPKQPTQRQATEEAEAETDEEFAIRQSQYASDKATFEAALEAARQTVDRIAFAGQVPVNVLGATAGQYIIPVNDNGAIKGEAVNEADMTLTQYMKAVGKVIAIESDGRAKIIVKVA